MTQSLFAVVYGAHWDDIKYFTDRSKALDALRTQSQHISHFQPILLEYNENDGVLMRSKNVFSTNISNDVILQA